MLRKKKYAASGNYKTALKLSILMQIRGRGYNAIKSDQKYAKSNN